AFRHRRRRRDAAALDARLDPPAARGAGTFPRPIVAAPVGGAGRRLPALRRARDGAAGPLPVAGPRAARHALEDAEAAQPTRRGPAQGPTAPPAEAAVARAARAGLSRPLPDAPGGRAHRMGHDR